MFNFAELRRNKASEGVFSPERMFYWVTQTVSTRKKAETMVA